MCQGNSSKEFRVYNQTAAAAAAAKSLQLWLTLCNSMTAAHQAPPSLGFSRQEHWSGLPFPSPMHESEKWKWKVKVKSLSRVRLLATPQMAAHQAPPSMGFSRQEYWSGVSLPSPTSMVQILDLSQLALDIWASFLTSLGCSALICKMDIITGPTTESCEDSMRKCKSTA